MRTFFLHFYQRRCLFSGTFFLYTAYSSEGEEGVLLVLRVVAPVGSFGVGTSRSRGSDSLMGMMLRLKREFRSRTLISQLRFVFVFKIR